MDILKKVTSSGFFYGKEGKLLRLCAVIKKGVVVALNFKRKTIVISSLLCVFVLALIWFQVSNKTTYGNILDRSISAEEEISHIIIEANIAIIGDALWTRIDNPELIDQLITGQSDVSLKKQFRKNTRILNHTMTIHTQSNSYFYDFDEDYFVGKGMDYKIASGSFIDIVRSLRNEIEWKASEAFLDDE